MHAQVVFNRPLAGPFTYRVPEGLLPRVAEGVLVRAVFGKRAEVGCVVALSDALPDGVEPSSVREIDAIAVDDFRLTREVLDLARFVSSYYFCALGEALCSASMVGFTEIGDLRAPLFRLREDWREIAGESLTPKQTVAAQEIAGLAPATRAELARRARVTTGVIERLAAAGLLLEADPEPDYAAPPADVAPALGADQQAALDAVTRAADEGRFEAFLLHGVTGSGKTEVYLRAMEHVRARGRTALCLVPEIALTPQTLLRFERRFQEPIGVSHSQMTRREKLLLARRIERGEIRVVIGARSAVFAPLPNLGLVVVDEEHDHSYKQGETPRYHGRDVAIVRAQRLGIPIILGSATPSLDSFANARAGKYTLVELPGRATGMAMPDVRVVDLTHEGLRAAHGPTQLSPTLVDAIQQRLDRREQTILFLNRRGFSNFLFCPSCKWVARCNDDDVALTYHRPRDPGAKDEEELDLFAPPPGEGGHERGFLKCHFCGTSQDAPERCPKCGAESLAKVGAGTQRVEEEIAAAFPRASIVRLDQDAAGGREKFLAAWQKMVSGEADIILGTQMIAKGLHLERVTLVGVVLADVGLFLPDFRAEERVFSLLMQVAGRAGRESPGEVVLQTYMPEHPSIRFAVQHDYIGYFEHENERRRRVAFPPHRKLVALTMSDEDRESAYKAARLMASILWRTRHQREARGVVVNGPGPAPMARLRGRWRFRVLLRGPAQSAIAAALRAALADPEWRLGNSTRLAIDVDPLDLL